MENVRFFSHIFCIIGGDMNERRLFAKCATLFILCLGVMTGILIGGCGGSSGDSAPAGSTITFSPTSWSFSIAGDTCAEFAVLVKYSNGTPMPKANVSIYGGFAFPRTPTHYQFYLGPNCVPGGSKAVDSGFTAQTDDFGVYSFSALVSFSSNTFSDIVYAYSGSAFGSATLESK
jgi:hypothetical protein